MGLVHVGLVLAGFAVSVCLGILTGFFFQEGEARSSEQRGGK